MHTVPSGIGHDPVGQPHPLRSPVRAPASNGPQPRRTRQPGLRPPPRFQLPDARVRLAVALPDGVDRDLGRLPAVRVQHLESVRSREQQQRLAERVELELPPGVVADVQLRRTRVPGQVERALDGHRVAIHRVRRHQSGAVVEQPVAHEGHRPVEEVAGAGRGHRLPGEALVADPGVAVVVVPPLLSPLGQGRRGGRDHRAAAAGQASQHRPRVRDVARCQGVRKPWHGVPPGLLRQVPGTVRVRWWVTERVRRDLEHQVLVLARLQLQLDVRRPVRVDLYR